MSLTDRHWVKNTIRKLSTNLFPVDMQKEQYPSSASVAYVRDELLDVSLSDIAALVVTLVVNHVTDENGESIQARGIKRSLRRIEIQLNAIAGKVSGDTPRSADEEDQEDIPF